MWDMAGRSCHRPRADASNAHVVEQNPKRPTGCDARARWIPPSFRNPDVSQQPSEIDVLVF